MSDDSVDSDTEGEAAEGDGDIDSDINADVDISLLNPDNAKYKGDFVDGVEPSPPESSEKGESEGLLTSNEQGKVLEPNQADQNELNAELNSEQFDPNESENIEVQNEFDPNVPDAEGNPDEFNPNAGGDGDELGFNPNTPEGNVEQEGFEPNEADEEGEPDQFNPNEGRENYESNEYDQYEMEGDDKSNYDPDNFEQEEHSGEFYENRYAESMNTILLSENLIYAYLQEYIELMGEKENEGNEQGEEAQGEQLKEEVSELEKFLEEERERIRLEQQQADLNEVIEPELEPIANEEEIEQEQEGGVGTQENISEEKVSDNEEKVENQELKFEEDLQSALPNESIESGKFEEIDEKNEEPLEKLEEREIYLKLNDDENEKYEQHQSETQFESDHEIDPESIVHKKELKLIREEHEKKEEHEEFFKEELEVHHEINSSETEVLTIEQEEELEQDNTSSYKEKERDIEEFEEHQQELEEILEQTRKIEQERENSDKSIEVKNYEKAKKLYSQETGKRPIYANKETKGFKEWLEQGDESARVAKGEQSKEQKVEQETEKEWTTFLENWINNESGEEVNLEMKNEVKQIVEIYEDLDELTTRFQELYKQEQLNQLSQSEKMELRALVKTLQKSDPSSIVLFTNLRALKRYLNRQKPEAFSNKTLINRTLNHLFTRSPVRQLSKILKFQKEINKNQQQQFTPEKSKNKIERTPTSEPKNTSNLEIKQLSMEQIKEEIKKIDWKNISENWTVKVNANREITLNPYELPSKENPLYKHKEWLQTVYNRKNWNLNDNMLRKISGVSNTTIYKWRRKLDIPTKLKLFNDGKQKECGRCHQIKAHDEFELRNDKRKAKPYLRSNCNKCKNELNQIYIFKNKLKILTNIYNGKFKEKCPECETKFSKLPAFDFHHPDKNLKKEKRIRMRGKWNKTMDRLEQEKTIPLCNSCHITKKATVFKKFKEIVLRKNNFENNLTGVESNIHQYIKSNIKPEENKHLHQIKSWIKKRIVTERLYNGNCIGCGEKNLPTFQFHHRDPEKKSFRSWTQLNFLNISEIMEKLIKDNAICLCGNCHNMAEARHFKENMSEILESKDLHEIKTFYEKLNRNINNYSFPKELESKVNYRSRIIQNKLAKLKEIETGTPLKESIEYQTTYGEAWKKYLFHINKLRNEGKRVRTKILAESVGVNTRNTRKNIQKLISKGMISIEGEHNNRTILLTEKGKEESKKNYPYIYK